MLNRERVDGRRIVSDRDQVYDDHASSPLPVIFPFHHCVPTPSLISNPPLTLPGTSAIPWAVSNRGMRCRTLVGDSPHRPFPPSRRQMISWSGWPTKQKEFLRGTQKGLNWPWSFPCVLRVVLYTDQSGVHIYTLSSSESSLSPPEYVAGINII